MDMKLNLSQLCNPLNIITNYCYRLNVCKSFLYTAVDKVYKFVRN